MPAQPPQGIPSTPDAPVPPLGGPQNRIPTKATIPAFWQDRSRILKMVLDLFDKDPAAAAQLESFVEGLLAKINAGK